MHTAANPSTLQTVSDALLHFSQNNAFPPTTCAADLHTMLEDLIQEAESADTWNAPRFSLADLAAIVAQAAPSPIARDNARQWESRTVDTGRHSDEVEWHYCKGNDHARDYITNQIANRLDSRAEAERFRTEALSQ